LTQHANGQRLIALLANQLLPSQNALTQSGIPNPAHGIASLMLNQLDSVKRITLLVPFPLCNASTSSLKQLAQALADGNHSLHQSLSAELLMLLLLNIARRLTLRILVMNQDQMVNSANGFQKIKLQEELLIQTVQPLIQSTIMDHANHYQSPSQQLTKTFAINLLSNLNAQQLCASGKMLPQSTQHQPVENASH
jgi:hypothetical protein